MKKHNKFLWMLGFLGLYGFSFFKTQQTASLFWFAFLGYFGYYFIHKLSQQMPDERFFENSQRAKIKTAWIPMLLLFVVGFGTGFSLFSTEIIILVCALGYSASLISYAALFWFYDTH